MLRGSRRMYRVVHAVSDASRAVFLCDESASVSEVFSGWCMAQSCNAPSRGRRLPVAHVGLVACISREEEAIVSQKGLRSVVGIRSRWNGRAWLVHGHGLFLPFPRLMKGSPSGRRQLAWLSCRAAVQPARQPALMPRPER